MLYRISHCQESRLPGQADHQCCALVLESAQPQQKLVSHLEEPDVEKRKAGDLPRGVYVSRPNFVWHERLRIL